MTENYIWGFIALGILTLIGAYLAIFGKVDRSGDHKSISHRISKKN